MNRGDAPCSASVYGAELNLVKNPLYILVDTNQNGNGKDYAMRTMQRQNYTMNKLYLTYADIHADTIALLKSIPEEQLTSIDGIIVITWVGVYQVLSPRSS